MGDNNDKMTKRVAIFRNTENDYGWTMLLESHGNDERVVSNYVRISEWMDINFPPLTPEAIAGAALVTLVKQREEVVDEFAGKLKSIDERIANLRALTGPGAAP